MSTYSARILAHTPNDISYFLRGDNTFTNILSSAGSETFFTIQNSISGIELSLKIDNTNLIHGLYSSGAYDGTETTIDDGKWLIQRNSDGSVDMDGNAASATRIKGNLEAITDANGHNIWITSTNAGDGIPKRVEGVAVIPSTKTIVATTFSGNATSASYLKDKTNGTASYLDYGRSGITAGSGFTWIGVWDGYTLAPASKAAMFQAVRDSGGDSRWHIKGADNNHMTHTNEFNFIGSGFNNTVYINWRASGGTGTVTEYVFCKGSNSNTTTRVRCGYLTVTAQGSGAEGGEIFLAASSSGLYAAMDVYTNLWRIHSDGGQRFYVNLSTGAHADYAEDRKSLTNEPGRVYKETNECILVKTDKRLIPGCSVCSDTYGTSIPGDEDGIPFAVSGRVLVYPEGNRNDYTAGQAVCCGPNGTVTLMTREEIKEYPDCILGYTAGIPDEETWSHPTVELKGRIWIRLA